MDDAVSSSRGMLTETWLAHENGAWHGALMNVPRCTIVLPRRSALQLIGGAGLAAVFGSVPATAAPVFASDWSESSHSAIRLIRAQPVRVGEHRVGIALRMKPGFKTYWRHPGDSGVPPVFDFAKSQNLKSATVHFPRPIRFDDGAGGVSFGYSSEEVVLPVTVVADNPAASVMLRMAADYAVCEKLCVPAHGQAALELRDDGRGPFEAVLRTAMAAVPTLTKSGAAGPLQVLGLRKGAESEQFLVEVQVPDGMNPELFVEGQMPWFLEVKGFAPGTKGGSGAFTVLVVERDRSPDCAGADLTLTLAAGPAAVEVRTRLDMALITP
jgi:DsbC/DsbD-like thiol-disulfide interchange protein